ncbi:MAG: hypothetical protein MI750_02675 [Xanthomonadales bacterium]|nr:hypothetical protein [Xanthomonadales bacterium]
MKRIRTLFIIVLIALAVTPGVLGWVLRMQLSEQLTKLGVAPERIVVVAGWLESRVVFPVPNGVDLEADIVFRHGPYLRPDWGWTAARGQLLYQQQSLMDIDSKLGFGLTLSGVVKAAEGLKSYRPEWQWQQLQSHFHIPLLSQTWSGQVQGQGLQFQDATLSFTSQKLTLDWQWQAQQYPSLSTWLQLSGNQFSLSQQGVPLSVGQIEANMDWLEQGSTGSLRHAWQLTELQAAERDLDRLALRFSAAPLDRQTVMRLPALLPAMLAGDPNARLHLMPLLALRPQLLIDTLTVSHDDQAIQLQGTITPRPGGAQVKTQGGGPRHLFLTLIQLSQFYQDEDPFFTRAEQATATLETVRRQGWLQRRGNELRADIIINY